MMIKVMLAVLWVWPYCHEGPQKCMGRLTEAQQGAGGEEHNCFTCRQTAHMLLVFVLSLLLCKCCVVFYSLKKTIGKIRSNGTWCNGISYGLFGSTIVLFCVFVVILAYILEAW